MAAWKPHVLQAVWFTSRLPIAPTDEMFKSLVGTAPASLQNIAGGTTIAIGNSGGSFFRLQLMPGRVDLFETPQVQSISLFPLFPELAPALADFRGRIQRVGAFLGDVARVAMVINVSEQVSSAIEASKLAAERTGIPLPFADATDFIFQINRRKPFIFTKNLEMNRVLKWAAQSFQQVDLTTGTPVTSSVHFATLSVDVNLSTSADQTLFAPDDQIAIFGEISAEIERLCTANSLNAFQ